MSNGSLADRLGGGSGMFRKGAAAAEQARPKPAGDDYRPNRYGGKCIVCGRWVPENAGKLAKNDSGKWAAQHLDCTTAAPAQPSQSDRPVIRVMQPVPDGKYTITFEDGSYRTLRVRTQDESASFKPGHQIVDFLSGSDNDNDYTGFADINDRGYANVWRKHLGNTELIEALRVLVADPKAAATAYGQRSGRCGLCGRTLTVPSSIEAGMGPDCAKKFEG